MARRRLLRSGLQAERPRLKPCGMIEHISLRCRDSRASRKFYEQALAPLGYKVDKEYGDAFGFIQGGRHDFWITEGKVGTPNHVAFHAHEAGAVDEFYRAAMAAGGKDNGPPGPRDEYGYAAFVLDPDGHNVEAVIWHEELKAKSPRRKATAGKRGATAGKRRRRNGSQTQRRKSRA